MLPCTFLAVSLACVCGVYSADAEIRVGRTTVSVATPTIVRVTHSPTDVIPVKHSLVVKPDWPKVPYQVTETKTTKTITTTALAVQVDKNSGEVTMLDASEHNVLLAEDTTSFSPGADQSYVVEQSWARAADGESLFGGGEYQNGLLDYATETLQMIQFNTQAIVPFFVSSTGYGLLWDNYAASYLNAPAADSLLPFHTVALSTPNQFNASASFVANQTGEHNFYVELHQPPSFGSGMGITLKLVQQGAWVYGFVRVA